MKEKKNGHVLPNKFLKVNALGPKFLRMRQTGISLFQSGYIFFDGLSFFMNLNDPVIIIKC